MGIRRKKEKNQRKSRARRSGGISPALKYDSTMWRFSVVERGSRLCRADVPSGVEGLSKYATESRGKNKKALVQVEVQVKVEKNRLGRLQVCRDAPLGRLLFLRADPPRKRRVQRSVGFVMRSCA